jgi:hypothetical protein
MTSFIRTSYEQQNEEEKDRTENLEGMFRKCRKNIENVLQTKAFMAEKVKYILLSKNKIAQ